MTDFLWVTDPWETLSHAQDTTLRLAQEALQLRFKNYWCDVRSIRWQQNHVILTAREILSIAPDRSKKGFHLGSPQEMEPSHFSQIHYRTDPPLDLAYIHPLQLLSLGLQKNLGNKGPERIINPPSVLLMANEKLEAGLLSSLMPPTVATSQWEHLLQLGLSEKKTVLKPMNEAQSHGVELLDWSTNAGIKKAQKILDQVTHHFTRPVILQKYLKGILKGETRLWFLDGKLLAHARKLPLRGDFRVNIDRGSGLARQGLTSQDKSAAKKIGRHLHQREIRLAAIDLIDGYVTDFNFTSPGLIVQMEQVLEKNLALAIIRSLTIKHKLGSHSKSPKRQDK